MFNLLVETVTIGVVLALLGMVLLFLSKFSYSSVNLNSYFQLFVFLLIAGMVMHLGYEISGWNKKFCDSRL